MIVRTPAFSLTFFIAFAIAALGASPAGATGKRCAGETASVSGRSGRCGAALGGLRCIHLSLEAFDEVTIVFSSYSSELTDFFDIIKRRLEAASLLREGSLPQSRDGESRSGWYSLVPRPEPSQGGGGDAPYAVLSLFSTKAVCSASAAYMNLAASAACQRFISFTTDFGGCPRSCRPLLESGDA
jgi:hypothetical protein